MQACVQSGSLCRSQPAGKALASKKEKKSAETSSASYTRHSIFTYKTDHLAHKDKVRFYYALKGRDGKSGILKYTKARHLGPTVLLVSSSTSQTVENFLNDWECIFQRKEVLLEP